MKELICPECGADLSGPDAVKVEERNSYSGSFKPENDRVEYDDDSNYMETVIYCSSCCEEVPIPVDVEQVPSPGIGEDNQFMEAASVLIRTVWDALRHGLKEPSAGQSEALEKANMDFLAIYRKVERGERDV